MNTFRTFIEKYTYLPPDDWERIAGCFERRVLQKEEVLLESGRICRHLYFLESGLLRYYVYKDGTDFTKFFTDAPYCFTSQLSFSREIPATESIQALEPSVIWQTSFGQAHELLVLDSWNTFVRRLIQEVQYYTEQILEEIQTETAAARYEKMLHAHPDMVNRIPLRHLASYLGIAQPSLSRIRKNIMVKKRISPM